ncbi:hypothetical protein, partial [Delftia sp. S66]|uniref:hypothetical protein n=1 Tax=Delftia sp. S66 TaxID=2767437 RepID=UPI001F301107
QDCNPATTTPQALTYGEFARAFASLGPWFEAERSDGAGCWLLATPQPPPFCPTQVARSEAKGRGQCGARFFASFLIAR